MVRVSFWETDDGVLLGIKIKWLPHSMVCKIVNIFMDLRHYAAVS